MPMTPSMRADNFYSFACPLTQKLERYLHCMLRRHKHWRGEKIEPVCATCMNAGKCPALAMLDREWREDKAIYMDQTPGRARKVPDDIAKLVENKVISSGSAYGTGIDRVTLERLMGQKMTDKAFLGVETNTIFMGGTDDAVVTETSGSRASVNHGAAHAAATRADRQRFAAMRPKVEAKAAPVSAPKEGSLVDAIAGASTDMAGAINQAIKNAGEAV